MGRPRPGSKDASVQRSRSLFGWGEWLSEHSLPEARPHVASLLVLGDCGHLARSPLERKRPGAEAGSFPLGRHQGERIQPRPGYGRSRLSRSGYAGIVDGIRVALAQIDPTVGDLEGNAAMLVEAIEAARERGADLVAAPEMVVTGYPA